MKTWAQIEDLARLVGLPVGGPSSGVGPPTTEPRRLVFPPIGEPPAPNSTTTE